jgi:hypothetical protein
MILRRVEVFNNTKDNTEIYLQIKMGQKNGKPVLTEEQAEALGASSGMDASQVGFF